MADLGNLIGAVRNGDGDSTARALLRLADGLKLLEGEISTLRRNAENVTDHASLQNLDFASSGHTGFAGAVDLTLKADKTTQAIAGGGLTGSGTLAADFTFAVGAGAGISVSADAVAIDQAAGLSWTGAHSHTQRATFTGGLTLGNTVQSSVSGSARFTLNPTVTQGSDDVLDLVNTADSNRFMQVSSNGEFGFGKLGTGSGNIYQAGNVLGFLASTNTVSSLLGGIFAVMQINSAASPARAYSIRGALALSNTSATIPADGIAALQGVAVYTADHSGLGSVEAAAVLGYAAAANNANTWDVGAAPLKGNWKRFSMFRAGNIRGATGTNRPAISTAFCAPIQGYSATTGKCYAIETIDDNGVNSVSAADVVTCRLVYPRRALSGTQHRGQLEMEPWPSTTAIRAGAIAGDVIYDSGVNFADGLWEFCGGLFGYVVNDQGLVANGGGAVPTLGTIGGAGPAAAAQAGWVKVKTSGGVVFLPYWV